MAEDIRIDLTMGDDKALKAYEELTQSIEDLIPAIHEMAGGIQAIMGSKAALPTNPDPSDQGQAESPDLFIAPHAAGATQQSAAAAELSRELLKTPDPMEFGTDEVMGQLKGYVGETGVEPGVLERARQRVAGGLGHIPWAGATSKQAFLEATDEAGAFTGQTLAEGSIFGATSALSGWAGRTASSATETAGAVINPFNLMQAGQESGLAGGPIAEVGGVGIQLPGGEALTGGAASIWESFKGGLAPGQTWGETLGMQAALEEVGYAKGTPEYESLTALNTRIVEETGGDIRGLSAGSRAQVFDELTRYGGTSEDKIVEYMTGLADAAKGARMSLEDFQAGVAETAEGLQQTGLGRYESYTAAKTWSATTNMAPQTLGQVMSNPFFQGQAAARVGIPPEAQGLIANEPALMNDLTLDTIKMMRGTLGGVAQSQPYRDPLTGNKFEISGREQEDALIAHQLDITPEELKAFEQNAKTTEIQGSLTSNVREYHQSARDITTAFEKGKISQDQYDKQHQALREGTGRYSGSEVSWMDIKDVMGQNQSGISPAQRQHLEELYPSQRKKELESIIQKNAPRRLAKDANQTQIKFTGWAEKVLKEVIPGNTEKAFRRSVNQGAESALGPNTRSGDNNIAALVESPPEIPTYQQTLAERNAAWAPSP